MLKGLRLPVLTETALRVVPEHQPGVTGSFRGERTTAEPGPELHSGGQEDRRGHVSQGLYSHPIFTLVTKYKLY